jgi:hypothetical protein
METRLAKRKRSEEEGDGIAEGRGSKRSNKKTTTKEPQLKQGNQNPVPKRPCKRSLKNSFEPVQAAAPDKVVGQDLPSGSGAHGPEHAVQQPPGPGVTKKTQESDKAQPSAEVNHQGMAGRARGRLEEEGAGDDDQAGYSSKRSVRKQFCFSRCKYKTSCNE